MDIFKTLIWDVYIEKWIVSLVGGGFWGFILTPALRYLTNQLYGVIALGLKMEAIVLKNAEAQRAYTLAAVDLYELAKTSGIDSEAFRKARDAHKQALSDLVRF